MSGHNGSQRLLFFEHAPQRVVSLVPSITESLFELGMGDALVGITDYCMYPPERVVELPRLGGPKNPRLEEIVALHPDLVIANMEENTRAAVEALEAAGLAVWVTFPRTVSESMEVLWKLVELFRSVPARIRLQTLEVTLDWAIQAANQRSTVRYFCPIWYQDESAGTSWWMTFNQETYCHDLLRQLGGENSFAGRQRLYPLAADLGQSKPEPAGERDTRYPRLVLSEILAAQPQVILLPSEPFGFHESHLQLFQQMMAETPAVQNGRMHLVDGSLITWHGTRLARALQELPALFEIFPPE
jgi:ABC-type Fe3+-hydroxamate transport system substrate-binding protein